jgi:hypothetical protein
MITDASKHGDALRTTRYVFVRARYVACTMRMIGVTKPHLRWIIADGDCEHLGFWYAPSQDLTALRHIAELAMWGTQ